MNTIQLRPALKEESRLVAEFYRIASDGVADYIWSLFAQPGEDLLDVGAQRYAREDTDFSYQNCTMVDVNGDVAGMLIAYPMGPDAGQSDLDQIDPVLRPFAILEEPNSYYICGVALHDAYRGQGLGSQLMARAEADAIDHCLGKTSLIVFEENAGAKRLYDRLGYHVVKQETLVPHPLIRHLGEAFLMVKKLESY